MKGRPRWVVNVGTDIEGSMEARAGDHPPQMARSDKAIRFTNRNQLYQDL